MCVEKENEEKIVNCGVFGYNAAKMANILNVDSNLIEAELKNQNSDFFRLYQKGIDLSDYVIDLKLFEMAKSGDIKALEKLDARKKARAESELKKKIEGRK